MNKQKGIFRYPGGKSTSGIQQRIFSLAPEYESYREPFVGGGGIFWAVPQDKERWINDRDDALICVYRALRDRPDEFLARCREIPTTTRDGDHTEVKRQFKRFASGRDNIDPALWYLFVNRTTWGGKVHRSLYCSNPGGWSASFLDRLIEAAQAVADANITNLDYEQVMMTPGERVWCYCDPPYVKELRSTSRLYRYVFDDEDHERLAEVAKSCPHQVMVSYEDDPRGLVRSLYRGWEIHSAPMAYCGTSLTQKVRGKELIICNYEAVRPWKDVVLPKLKRAG